MSHREDPIIKLPLASLSKPGLVHKTNISFSYQMGTKTNFKKKAKGNSKMAYLPLRLSFEMSYPAP